MEDEMKLKQKMIMDGTMMILLLVLMNYDLTGGLIHEFLGIVILVGFIIHAAANRRYYAAMIKAIKRGEAGTRNKVAFAINIILPFLAILMLLSSVAVSRELLPGISVMFRSEMWVPIHIICAVVLLICVFIHVCLHAKMISAFIGQYAESPALQKLKSAGMRVMAFLFALLVIKSSFSNMTDAVSLLPSGDPNQSEFDSDSNKQSNEMIIEDNDTGDQDGYVIEIEPEPEAEETVSLEDYLGSLFCSGCGRHCSLLSPRCGKGENQASQAAEEYYETYSGQSV
jgi:hypothetical protein